MATPSKNGSRLALIAVLIPLGFLLYYISPLVMPRWRWEHMDNKWEELASSTKLPQTKLKQVYDVVVRYKPRGDKDPLPWQVLTSTPLYDPQNDEEFHIVRVTLISDHTGDPPSSFLIGSGNYRDVFFKGKAWRFPPGTFGFNKFRPVVVYDGWNFDKLESTEAYRWDGEMKETTKWVNDDTDIEDGYKVPSAAQ